MTRSSPFALRRCQRGAGTAEYIVVVGVVALAVIAGVRTFGHSVTQTTQAEGQAVATLSTVKTGGGSSPGATDMAPAPAPGSVPSAGGAVPGTPSPGGPAPISYAPPGAPGGPVCEGDQCPGGGKNCFVAGTPVAAADGLRPIEEIQTGDVVLSRDEGTGEISLRRVTDTYVRGASALVDVTVVDLDDRVETIRATPEHPFWTASHGWTDAGALRSSDRLVDAAGREVLVASVDRVPAQATVYNLSVESTDTYFVGSDRVWVHNYNPYDPGDRPSWETSIVDQVWFTANDYNGGYCPACGDDLSWYNNRNWDIDHTLCSSSCPAGGCDRYACGPWAERQWKLANAGITDYETHRYYSNANVQALCASCNRSHRYEDTRFGNAIDGNDR
jgi:Flp pilus assembly pilin Flp